MVVIIVDCGGLARLRRIAETGRVVFAHDVRVIVQFGPEELVAQVGGMNRALGKVSSSFNA